MFRKKWKCRTYVWTPQKDLVPETGNDFGPEFRTVFFANLHCLFENAFSAKYNLRRVTLAERIGQDDK